MCPRALWQNTIRIGVNHWIHTQLQTAMNPRILHYDGVIITVQRLVQANSKEGIKLSITDHSRGESILTNINLRWLAVVSPICGSPNKSPWGQVWSQITNRLCVSNKRPRRSCVLYICTVFPGLGIIVDMSRSLKGPSLQRQMTKKLNNN